MVQFLFPRLYKAPALFHSCPKKLRQHMEEGSHRLASCGDLVSARTGRLSMHWLVATWCQPPCCSFVASGGAAGGDLVSAAGACRQNCRQFRWQPSAMVVSNSGSRPHQPLQLQSSVPVSGGAQEGASLCSSWFGGGGGSPLGPLSPLFRVIVKCKLPSGAACNLAMAPIFQQLPKRWVGGVCAFHPPLSLNTVCECGCEVGGWHWRGGWRARYHYLTITTTDCRPLLGSSKNCTDLVTRVPYPFWRKVQLVQSA